MQVSLCHCRDTDAFVMECHGPMDCRLVEAIDGANYAGNGNISAADVKKKKEYEELLVGICNLPL